MVDLDELERLVAQMSPGPWTVEEFSENGGYDCMYGSHNISSAKQGVIIEIDLRNYGQYPNDTEYRSPAAAADAAGIVALRAAAEELIRDARRWREYKTDMRRAIKVEEEQS